MKRTDKISETIELTPAAMAAAVMHAETDGLTFEQYIERLVAADVAKMSAKEKFPFLTDNAAAVVDRVCQEHGLTPQQFVAMAVEEDASWFEEDLEGNGVYSGGENEYGFVVDAKKLAAGDLGDWQVSGRRFYETLSRKLPRLVEDFGAIPA